jgi:hypothetical protein
MSEDVSLEILEPAVRAVSAGGRLVEVRPLRVRQIPAIVRALRPVLGSLPKEMDGAALLELYCEHAESITAAIAVMVDLAPEEVGELEIGAAIELFAICLEVNRDFFTRTLPGLFGKAAAAISGAGPTS